MAFLIHVETGILPAIHFKLFRSKTTEVEQQETAKKKEYNYNIVIVIYSSGTVTVPICFEKEEFKA